MNAVRVCAAMDAECSRGCGSGPCAADAGALTGPYTTRNRNVGDWLWCELMDYCKERGIPPASNGRLFDLVGRARAAWDIAPSPANAQPAALEEDLGVPPPPKKTPAAGALTSAQRETILDVIKISSDRRAVVMLQSLLAPSPASQSAEDLATMAAHCRILESRIERYQALCAAAYQLAGAVDAPVRFLDALSEGSNGNPLPEEMSLALLPVTATECGTPAEHCQCPACANGTIHASDCAVHNAPAMPNGSCDCGAAS